MDSANTRPPTLYAYVVLDTSTTPHTPLKYELTRKAAQEYRHWQHNADALRVKRARVVVYTT